jgi:putative superfamily III holin-X
VSGMQTRSIPDLFMDVVAQLATLLRKEGELARTEISEKVTQVATSLGLVVTGAVFAVAGLVILLQAAVAALAENAGLSQPLAALIVGGAALILGVILKAIAASRMKAERLVPHKTIHQLQRDIDVAKEQARTDHERQQAA